MHPSQDVTLKLGNQSLLKDCKKKRQRGARAEK